ncbi:hypothetical protein CR513_12445, partial [Mucuna pruriens]
MQTLDCLGYDDYTKLQRMYQGPKSVDEYFKEMGVTLIRVQIVKSQEATMGRFLSRLNRDIQDIMELHDYTSISMLVHQASKVESQLKRQGKKNPTQPIAPTRREGKEHPYARQKF